MAPSPTSRKPFLEIQNFCIIPWGKSTHRLVNETGRFTTTDFQRHAPLSKQEFMFSLLIEVKLTASYLVVHDT